MDLALKYLFKFFYVNMRVVIALLNTLLMNILCNYLIKLLRLRIKTKINREARSLYLFTFIKVKHYKFATVRFEL